MEYIIVRSDNKNELAHWGIKGQKWGVRRYENEDGTLTAEGKVRYGYGSNDDQVKKKEIIKKLTDDMKNLDKLSVADRKRVGTESLKQITSKDNTRREIQDLEIELALQIDKRSGNWNTGESVSEGHRKAMKELDEISDEMAVVRERIKTEIDYKPIPYTKAEQKSLVLQSINAKRRKDQEERYVAALKRDNDYYRLSEKFNKASDNLVSAVIDDLGFEDTPDVRSALEYYVFND